MTEAVANSIDMKVFLNHIYEFKKGVRQMILYTFDKRYERFATERLKSLAISYEIRPIGNNRINLFFGKKECMQIVKMIINRPLNQLTAEEDFILGTLLGYDLCAQCERYCERKEQKELRLNKLP